MLQATPISGNNQYAAAHYFAEGDDYYGKDEPGQWQGLAAQALGLTGAIDPKLFARMLNGEVPNGQKILRTFNSTSTDKRMGVDFTFSAPKSVSMQALVGGDFRVTQAHDKAVAAALVELEKLVEARRKVDGKSLVETTGAAVIGKFRHELSREKDPQLHTHALVLNMTQRADGAWRAMHNGRLFKAKSHVDAVYQAVMAKELQALGYGIRIVDGIGNFELAHISREQIEAFSARSKVIEDALAEQGKTRATATPLEKQVIALATRKRKEHGDLSVVKQYWVEKSREFGVDYGVIPEAAMVRPRQVQPELARPDQQLPQAGEGQQPGASDGGAGQQGAGADRPAEGVPGPAGPEAGNAGAGLVPADSTPAGPVVPSTTEAGGPGGVGSTAGAPGGGQSPATPQLGPDQSGAPHPAPVIEPWRPSAPGQPNHGQGAQAIDRAAPAGPTSLDRGTELERSSLPKNKSPAMAAIEYAIHHHTEREQVVDRATLLSTAIRRAVGLATPLEIEGALTSLVKKGTVIESAPRFKTVGDQERNSEARTAVGWRQYLIEECAYTSAQARKYVEKAIARGSLVPQEARYTTQRALKREQTILAIEKSGRGAVTPILSALQVERSLVASPANDGQRQAITSILASSDRFIGIQGDAGVGKTFTVKQAVDLIAKAPQIRAEAQLPQGASAVPVETPYRVIAVAPYGNQVKALKEEGLQAHTLASFLATKHKPVDERTLVVLDEAGVVSARQMEQFMRVIERSGARAVLLGDTKQTEAIEAGAPFAQLQASGMATSRISEIQRQSNLVLREAVEHAAAGRMALSVGGVQLLAEQQDPSARRRALVDDYLSRDGSARDKTLIVTGTNEARREINQLTRAGLGLAGQGTVTDTLVRVDTTQAQRRFAPTYKVGMVVEPEKDYQVFGLKRGALYTVAAVEAGNLLVLKDEAGNTHRANPRAATRLSVYTLERTELAVGDTIRINRNDAALDLTNGDRLKVAKIEPGQVTLQAPPAAGEAQGRQVVLPLAKPLHLEHAYSSTVHSAQGLTTDRSLLDIDTKSRTTSMNLWYVAISRARQEAHVYTNARTELPAAISRQFTKTLAMPVQAERLQMRGKGLDGPALS